MHSRVKYLKAQSIREVSCILRLWGADQAPIIKENRLLTSVIFSSVCRSKPHFRYPQPRRRIGLCLQLVQRYRGIVGYEDGEGRERVSTGTEKPHTVLSIPSRITVRGSSNRRAKRHADARRRGRQRETMTGSHYHRHYNAPLTLLSIPNFRRF